MNRNMNSFRISFAGAWIVAGLLVSVPFFVSAQSLVPCGDSGNRACGFNDLIVLANRVVNFLLYSVCIPLAALGFTWAGGNLIINRDKEGAWSDAKDRFWDILKGFGIIIVAFVVVKAFLFAFLDADAGFTAFLLG